jgi:hypothetical protein
LRHAEAQGWLHDVQRSETRGGKGKVHVSYTFRYSFRLPDGSIHQGQSSSSHPIHPPGKRAAGQDRPPDVTVEYHPEYHGVNRLRGTWAGIGALFVLPLVRGCCREGGSRFPPRQGPLPRRDCPSDFFILESKASGFSATSKAAQAPAGPSRSSLA